VWPNQHRGVQPLDDLRNRWAGRLDLGTAVTERILRIGEAVDLTRAKVEWVRYGRVATVYGAMVMADGGRMVFDDEDDLGLGQAT
jgi:hypothetical protein